MFDIMCNIIGFLFMSIFLVFAFMMLIFVVGLLLVLILGAVIQVCEFLGIDIIEKIRTKIKNLPKRKRKVKKDKFKNLKENSKDIMGKISEMYKD